MSPHDDEDVAMQTRCLHCGREQYALAVIGVSTGELGCSWCGVKSEQMTRDAYYEKLNHHRTYGFPIDDE
jgi:transcription elongation factor Elf1